MIPKNEYQELCDAIRAKVDNISQESKIQGEYDRMKSAETQRCEENIKKIQAEEPVHEEVCNTKEVVANAKQMILEKAKPLSKNFLKFVRICFLVLIGISIVSVFLRFNSVLEWAEREDIQHYKMFFVWPFIYTLFFESIVSLFTGEQSSTFMLSSDDQALNEKVVPYLEYGALEADAPLLPLDENIIPSPFKYIAFGIVAVYLVIVTLLRTGIAELLMFIFSWSGIISGVIMIAAFFIINLIIKKRSRNLEERFTSIVDDNVDFDAIESAMKKDASIIEKNNQADLALEEKKAHLIEQEKQQIEVRLSDQVSRKPEMRDYFKREQDVLSYLKRTLPNMVLETLLDGDVQNNLLELANVCAEDEITTIKEAGLTWQSRVLDAEVSAKEENQKAMKSRLNLQEINARLDNISFQSSLNEKLSLMKLETNIARLQADGAISSLNSRTRSVSEKRDTVEKLLSEAEETK